MGVPYQNTAGGGDTRDNAGVAVTGPELTQHNYDGENEEYANIWTGYMSVNYPGYCEHAAAAVRWPPCPGAAQFSVCLS